MYVAVLELGVELVCVALEEQAVRVRKRTKRIISLFIGLNYKAFAGREYKFQVKQLDL